MNSSIQSFIFLILLAASSCMACHYRTAYLSASDIGNETAFFTMKIARSTANCMASQYSTVLFDQGLGAGYVAMNQNTTTDIANYQIFLDQTYMYTIGGNNTYVYTASGPLQYPPGTTVVDASMELNKRNTNVQNLNDPNTLSEAHVHLILGSNYVAPIVYTPDIIYLPLGVNVQNYQLGVFSPLNVTCVDVTAVGGQLDPIFCGLSALTVNPNCTLAWDLTDTGSCQAGMQWYIRFQATDSAGNSMTMETVVAIVSQFGTLDVVSRFDAANNTACQANGQQDPGEVSASGLPVRVQLLGAMALTMNADFNAYLVASSYNVQVTLPPGYGFTLYQVGPSGTWNDIPSNGMTTVVVNTNQTTRLGIGVTSPQIVFTEPTSISNWKMYYPQRIEWCHSRSIGAFNMTIYLMHPVNATYSIQAKTIDTFWDGVPQSTLHPLLASDAFTTWIPHNVIPGMYYLDARYIDKSNRTYDFYSEKFYLGVHI